MKTTLVIADPLMQQLREKAARERRSISALVEEAIRTHLQEPPPALSLRPLPRYEMGTPRVDLGNRDELYRVMEEE